MIAQRRLHWNFALQHAVDRALEFEKPLLIFEPLRVRYQWASDRIHRFIIEGMRDNAAEAESLPVVYYPYVEPRPGKGSPLLHRLAEHACTVVTDEYPCFFLPHMIDAVKDKLPARLELIDSNGVLPLRAAEKTYTVAHSYRRFMQKNILPALEHLPLENPLEQQSDRPALPCPDGKSMAKRREALIDKKILAKWPAADLDHLLDEDGLAEIPIDHSVPPAEKTPGGRVEACRRWNEFLDSKLSKYNDDRNHPDEHATTGLSPHLHFGHISAHEMVASLLEDQGWTADQTSKPNGKNHDFWNVGENAEALLDQLLTWREIGFNWSFQNPDTYDSLESLPDWAQKTLAETRDDERPHVYTLEEFETANTHDELWNAAQTELVQTGEMHNYMRMLWGKKIFHWTETPEEALEIMIHLNNKYGLDGRDPNSYCGILWVLGRTDRAWGPKRPVFGSVRYMTSDSTRKKLKLSRYLKRFSQTTKSK
ncbi:deoxyribodipyrimidine photolyase [Rhodopirellula sp. JC740]|uniref:Deoxyribodipyrimidine photolyase n=1 Tax=Rhodopirellula halodulae TaxID=2894198 RepID=A0ABS8NMI8_9BACT|nr:deoxyribodipyrimidine photolyase [Rhodopirellula sp. JC740]MCC9643993.1 deoxyribodipyrimidine photolyase [Rhodopirellula sp. JC740]